MTTLAERMSRLDVSADKPERPNGSRTESTGAQILVAPPIVDEELERFRLEWQKEVETKKDKDTSKPGPSRSRAPGPSDTTGDVKNAAAPVSPKNDFHRVISPSRSKDHKSSSSYMPDSAAGESDALTPQETVLKYLGRNKGKMKNSTALQVYAQAVESEQAGQLSEALNLYRQAFKMDDSIDRLYAQSRRDLPEELEDVTPTTTDIVSASAPTEQPYSFQRHIQVSPDYEKVGSGSASTRQSPLAKLLQSASIPMDEAAFLPAEENLPMPISAIPSELFDQILLHLDVLSLERLALTCWKARYLTSRSAKWKRLAESLYIPPAILPQMRTQGELAQRHAGEWRTVMIEEERVRFDGCYISVCHYVRPGAGDQEVAITHLITYHRFLRFYPDGSVISFLTTDTPGDVVPLLKPNLRSKGLHFGQWRLLRSDSDENTVDHLDKTLQGKLKSRDGKKRPRIVVTDLAEPGREPKYEFEMELVLKETQRGRWNKLEMISYSSLNLATEESLALSLKHQKPFFFSKVRSYNPPL